MTEELTRLQLVVPRRFIEKLPSEKLRATSLQVLKNDSSAAVSPRVAKRSGSAFVKRQVWLRAEGCCQYVDPVPKRKCDSTYALQYDHIIPFAKGGLFSFDNIRLLCRTHNKLHAIQHFSQKHMQKFSRV